MYDDSGVGDLRAADSDREHQAEVLRQAAAEGRLSFEELEERLHRVYTAKTYSDLAGITRDLPGGELAPNVPAGSSLTRTGPREVQAFFSEQKLTGSWLAPRRMFVRPIVGSVTLDFSQASMPHEVIVDVQVLIGQFTLIVPDDVAVEFEPGTTFLGERKNQVHTQRTPGTPVIKVRGPVLLGELNARPPKRGTLRKWLRRGRT